MRFDGSPVDQPPPDPPADHGGGDGEPVEIPIPTWVISDTHLGHAGILDYCPWRQTWAATLAEHDAAILTAWRATVGPQDRVLHLGDLAMGDLRRLPELRQQLPGRIVLVKGNHDPSGAKLRAAGFDLVVSAVSIQVGDHRWIARHNPGAFSLREARNAERLLHGHTHGNGYHDAIHPEVRRRVVDCSMDALRNVAPIPWRNLR